MSMKHGLSVAILALFAVACTGPAGIAGPQGSTGAAGTQGYAGMTGSQGQAGLTGAQGQPGMTGAQGQAGVTGAQGRPGVAGAANPAPAGTSWTSLRDIMFDYNRPEIRPTEMSQNPSVRLGIDGSNDLLRGTNQYNAALSQQRVGNVREALIRAGVSADRIETGGFGAERAKCSD